MADIRTWNGGQVGTSVLADDTFTFGERLRPAVLREAVVMYEANKRVGTVNTLSRRFVTGSGRKIQRQKHTGRARHGDRKAPLMRGGGVAHGPHPRDHSFSLPRRALKRALQIALAGKLRDGEVAALSGLDLDKPSTRKASAALAAIGAGRSALIVAPGPVDPNLLLSVRNLPRVRALPAAEVSAYDVVAHRNLVLLDGAADALVGRLGGGAEADDEGAE
jgi:large subunit ribosomal protein L4